MPIRLAVALLADGVGRRIGLHDSCCLNVAVRPRDTVTESTLDVRTKDNGASADVATPRTGMTPPGVLKRT